MENLLEMLSERAEPLDWEFFNKALHHARLKGEKDPEYAQAVLWTLQTSLRQHPPESEVGSVARDQLMTRMLQRTATDLGISLLPSKIE